MVLLTGLCAEAEVMEVEVVPRANVSVGIDSEGLKTRRRANGERPTKSKPTSPGFP
jgi:hypothetical protein